MRDHGERETWATLGGHCTLTTAQRAIRRRQAYLTSGGMTYASGHWMGKGETCIQVLTKGRSLRAIFLLI